jgi:hypothetical protein
MQPFGVVVQVCPRLPLHTPLASQVPAQLSVSSAESTLTHSPSEQVLQLPGQSLSEQQASSGMQLPEPHGLKPAAQS